MANEETIREANEILKILVRSQLKVRRWSPEKAAKFAKEKGLAGAGLSANNIRAYKEGTRKTRIPKAEIIEAFETLFDLPIGTWANQVPTEDRDPRLLREKEYVINEQRQLTKNDEVWIISSRQFLEDTDEAIKEMVCAGLQKGVVYRYFFPSRKSEHPYGDDARSSYQNFRAKIHGFSFKESPQIYGYAIDAGTFPFLSKLHSIVRHSRQTGPSSAYCYIEIGVGNERTSMNWYPLSASLWSQIETQLHTSAHSASDSEVDKIRPLNLNLSAVRSRYISWFKNATNAVHYAKLRALMGHSGRRCVKPIIECLLRAQVEPRKGSWRYLDIGCGDGSITASIVNALKEGNRDTSVTILDPSPAQLKLANKNLEPTRVRSIGKDFEQFMEEGEKNEFDIITAVHSLYTVDDAYIPRIYDLLAPNGVACIWMGTLENNIVNAVANALDNEIQPGQKRNYAEDIYRIVDRSIFQRSSCTRHVEARTLTLDEAAAEDAILLFCSLQNAEHPNLHCKARPLWNEIKKRHDGQLPITDYLITLTRPAVTTAER
jgi:SAM-dependent methyltransferase/transcriptional regulator with XRE-family HTH domain